MTTIVVADDHSMVRRGVCELLEAQAGWTVVAEAADGNKAVELISRLQPAVAIVDVMMPGLNGLEVVRRVKRKAPDTRVVMLSMHADEPYVAEALRGGATGYVLKGTNMGTLVEAVRKVLAGQRYLSPPLSAGAIDAYLQRASEAGRPIDSYELLTTRERQVLHLAARGRTNGDIAEQLAIGLRAVEVQRASLMRKLRLATQADLIRYAAQRGIITDA
jgi:DNA-binding NarL/FixJ family response regulator